MEYLIGLEYILGLFNLQHVELADKLGIKKQNINMWVKRKQNIPKKYLPVLEELFGIEREYFSKELEFLFTPEAKNIENEVNFEALKKWNS